MRVTFAKKLFIGLMAAAFSTGIAGTLPASAQQAGTVKSSGTARARATQDRSPASGPG